MVWSSWPRTYSRGYIMCNLSDQCGFDDVSDRLLQVMCVYLSRNKLKWNLFIYLLFS